MSDTPRGFWGAARAEPDRIAVVDADERQWTAGEVLAGANRMSLPYFLVMNAIGGACWAAVFGGGAYLLGEQIKRVTGPVTLVLLIAAVGLVIAGFIYFRHHERELEQRAEIAISGAPFGGNHRAD